MKRVLSAISLVLIIALMFTTMNACSSQKDIKKISSDAETEDDTNKKIEISYWCSFNGEEFGVSDLSDTLYFKELEKKTGVKVNFKHPPIGQDEEQFNLMIASRDLTDVIECQINNMYPGGPEKAIADKVILNHKDIIDKYAPAYKKILSEHSEAKKQLTTDAGNMFGFGALTLMDYKSYGGFMIRKDWLDDLGLKSPETIDEWTNVLTEFKEKKNATAPFTSILYILRGDTSFAGAFGISNSFYMEDGKVKYGPLQPEYKDYLLFLKNWYDKGLIDPDFATLDRKTMDYNILNGKSGAFYGYIGGYMGRYLKGATDPKFDLEAVQFPVLNKGDEPIFTATCNEFRDFVACITPKCKNVEAVAKWLDYRYTDEGHMLKNFGVEGITYNIVEEVPKYTEVITNNPDGLSMSQALFKYMQPNNRPGVDDPNYLLQYYQYPQQQDALKVYSKYSENANKVLLPPITSNNEEAKELARLYTEIQTYEGEQFLKFVMGIEPIDNFDNFINQLKKMKIERVIELKQAALDRYNNR